MSTAASDPSAAQASILQEIAELRERMDEEMRPELLQGAQKILPVLKDALEAAPNPSDETTSFGRFIQSQLQGVISDPESYSDVLILTLIIGAGEALNALQPADEMVSEE